MSDLPLKQRVVKRIRKGHFRSIGTCEHFIHTGTILARFALNPRRGSGESRAAPDGIDEELGTGRGPKSRTQFRLPKLLIMDSDRLRRFSGPIWVALMVNQRQLGAAVACRGSRSWRVGPRLRWSGKHSDWRLADGSP
jgi:hypothetical protein